MTDETGMSLAAAERKKQIMIKFKFSYVTLNLNRGYEPISRSLSGILLQTDGPETENAPRPTVVRVLTATAALVGGWAVFFMDQPQQSWLNYRRIFIGWRGVREKRDAKRRLILTSSFCSEQEATGARIVRCWTANTQTNKKTGFACRATTLFL